MADSPDEKGALFGAGFERLVIPQK